MVGSSASLTDLSPEKLSTPLGLLELVFLLGGRGLHGEFVDQRNDHSAPQRASSLPCMVGENA